MSDTRAKDLIQQYDDLISYYQKLHDYNFSEEILSVVSFYAKNKETAAAQVHEKTAECDRLKECLGFSRDKVVKLSAEFENLTNHYQAFLNNDHVKEFLDESNENIIAALKCKIDNLEHELEALKLNNLMLNSNLKLAHESLNKEKSQREQIESEQKNLEYLSEKLCNLLLKYQQPNHQLEEMKESMTQTSCDDLINHLIESNSLNETYGCDNVPPKNIDRNKEGLKVKKSRIVVSDEASLQCTKIPTHPNAELSNSRILKTPEQPLLECDTCEKSFSKKIDITTHMREHTVKIIRSFHNNDKCDELFLTKNSGQKLEEFPTCDKNDHSDEEKITTGVLKEKRSGEQGQKSNNSKKGQNEVSNFCGICNKRYSSKYTLNQHLREVHSGEKPYECTECGKRSARKRDMETHRLVHRSQKPFKCSVCYVGFKARSNKRSHERMVHEGGGNFQCAHCGKRFCKRNDLISHIHTKHFSGFEKQFKCAICEKSFVSKYRLNSHMLTHTSQRPIKCTVCDRNFKNIQRKNTHEKTAHGKGIRFRCKHCDRGYMHKTFLIFHLRKVHEK